MARPLSLVESGVRHRLCVVDLDGTLISANSWQSFVLYALRRMPARSCTWLPAGVRRGLRLQTGLHFREAVLRGLQGLTASELDDLGRDLWRTSLSRTIRPAVVDAIYRWRRTNDLEVVVVSAAWEFLAKPACSVLQCENLIATELQFGSGGFSGMTAGDEVRGPRKVSALVDRFPDGIDWSASVALGNEPDDLPVLTKAGTGVLVNPSFRPPPGIRVMIV